MKSFFRPLRFCFIIAVLCTASASCTFPFMDASSKPHGSPKKNKEIMSRPAVTLPKGTKGTVNIADSAILLPELIDGSYKPVGKAYDITIKGQSSVDFGTEFAVLLFSYDKSKILAQGLQEEFSVCYFDTISGTWKNVDKVEVDYDKSQIKAYTSHFTTFVATASLVETTTVPPPPGGITADYPAGLGGSGHAIFSLVGEGFLYYQDRTYTIRPLSESASNLATFEALGLEGSMGISTMNGGTTADPQTAHKQFTGSDYITFEAKRDLDIYIMYDSRGGSNLTDISKDAPWLASYGFTADITTPAIPAPTRYYVQTTDAVGTYRVYKNTYTAGSIIHLDGNRKGVTVPGIDTNYWVIFKAKDNYSPNSASTVIVSPLADVTPPAEVGSLVANSANGGVGLTWTAPADSDFKEVWITYSPGGTTVITQASGTNEANILNLTNGTSYTFKIRTVDTYNNVSYGKTVTVIPSAARKVFYDGNENTGGAVPLDGAAYTNGQTVTVLDNTGALSRTGYAFAGWNTQADGAGTTYSAGSTFMMDAVNVTLYAKWTLNNLTVTFNSQGGSAVTALSATYNSQITAPTVPIRTGYTFSGWYKEVACTTVWNFSTDMITADTTLFAKWTIISCAVTFNSQGGSPVVALSAMYDTKITEPTVPIRMGFIFSGWYKEAACTTTWNFATDMITADTTLFAKWTLDSGISAVISIPADGSVSFAATLTVAKGGTLAVSVQETYSSYQWYLDGTRLSGQTGKIVSLDTTGLSAGFHELMVLVTDSSGTGSSGRCTISVTN